MLLSVVIVLGIIGLGCCAVLYRIGLNREARITELDASVDDIQKKLNASDTERKYLEAGRNHFVGQMMVWAGACGHFADASTEIKQFRSKAFVCSLFEFSRMISDDRRKGGGAYRRNNPFSLEYIQLPSLLASAFGTRENLDRLFEEARLYEGGPLEEVLGGMDQEIRDCILGEKW